MEGDIMPYGVPPAQDGDPCSALARARLLAEAGTHVWDHTGSMERGHLEQAMASAEAVSLAAGDGVKVRKRLMSILVEALENVIIHGSELHRTQVVLIRTGSDYRLLLGNVVHLVTAELLLSRVAILNEMDDDELREQHRKLLSDPNRTEHGGAGLGLITIARKSDRPIRVGTCTIDNAYANFCMDLRVSVA